MTVDEVWWAKTRNLPKTVALKKTPTVPVYEVHINNAVDVMYSAHYYAYHNKRAVLSRVGDGDDAVEGYIRAEVPGDLPHDELLVLLAGHRLPVDLDVDMVRDKRVKGSAEVVCVFRLVDIGDALFNPVRESEDEGFRHGDRGVEWVGGE